MGPTPGDPGFLGGSGSHDLPAATTEDAMNRRDTLKFMMGATALATTAGTLGRGTAFAQAKPAFTLPPLGYEYNALEPHIDTATMGFHHKNHHNAFIGNLNGLVEKYPDLATKPIDSILSDLSAVPEAVRGPVRNNLGGHWNHTYFWELMTPGGAKAPAGDLKAAIDGTFGDFDKMKAAFKQAGITRFGSGWAWLAVGKDKKLAIFNTPYQDTPHMDMASKPVIGIDVWEHAYYLKHQYKRADYIDIWWNVVNWDKASENFKKAVA
jgi:Fe-Mn family superoxide dismutase